MSRTLTSNVQQFGPALRSAAVLALCLACGCRWNGLFTTKPSDLVHYEEVAGRIQYDDVTSDLYGTDDVRNTPEPLTILKPDPAGYVDMTLPQVIEIGLQNSKVLRDLGGAVLRSPDTARTIHEPAIAETDPRFGTEAALSAFDTQFLSSAFFENNDRALNNTFFGGGTRTLKQDFNVYQTELTKRTAAGTQVTLRNNTVYDANNAPGNLFRSAWDTNIEAEMRQPLLQGAGLFFNRTAGPNGTPGLINGLLIARVNRDVSLADFEIGMRDYVSNLENAYWDLYFAYRELAATVIARDKSLETWQKIRANKDRRGFESDKEAQAREQYYRLKQDANNALTGRIQDGTRTNNGSSGGTFRRTGGVQVAERRLRLLMGWPINGGSLIRPITEPKIRPANINWDAALAEAMQRRPEIRKQKQRVKRRELQLAASRNFLKPRFDAVGRYRFRGFGKDLIDNRGDNSNPVDNAAENLTNGDFQEWQLGFEFSIPLGFRQAHAAVRNAELLVARERTILREQERQVVHDLSNAIADLHRASEDAKTAYNRVRAAKTRVASLEADKTNRIATPDQLLEAHSRLADADSRYYLSLVEYAIASRNVHYEKGSLLESKGVLLENAYGPSTSFPVENVSPIQSELQFPAESGGPTVEPTVPELAPVQPLTETAESKKASTPGLFQPVGNSEAGVAPLFGDELLREAPGAFPQP